MHSGRSVLVTGGAGFIGSRIAAALITRGDRVWIVDNLATGYRRNLPAGATFIQADIASAEAVEALPWGSIDSVLHLAAQSSGEVSREQPLLDLDVNVRGTFLLLDACMRHGVKRFVYASSMASYGDKPDSHVHESQTLRPLSFYGISKSCAESYVTWHQQHGLDTTILRMFSVYGPGQDLSNMKQGMVSIFLSFILKDEPIHVKGSGARIRDFIAIDDVVSAWLRVLDDDRSIGETYNLGSGRPTRVDELIPALLQATGAGADYPVIYDGSTPDDQMGLYADTSRLQALGWSAQTPLNVGLAALAEYAKAHDSPATSDGEEIG